MGRSRRSSMMSFRKSSSGSVPTVTPGETPKEKERFHITTKADPTKAINEAEPATRNATEAMTIQSLRTMEFRDTDGNLITDPDRSNPTRPRMERPLDTIRSFEAAIDGSYNRRASIRPESATPFSGQGNRRSGYFSGYPSQQRVPENSGGYGGYGGYYSNRNGYGRPDSSYDNSAAPSNQYSRRVGSRNYSDPGLYGHNSNQGVYPMHGQQASYDTVGSASNGSYATEPWGNSTDPSSENSSIDRVQATTKPDLGEAYGFHGFGGAPQFQGPILEEHGHNAPAYGELGYGHGQVTNGSGHQSYGDAPPPPPPHKDDRPRRLQMNGRASASGNRGPIPVSSRAPPPVQPEKRKSWLKRRFSRGS